ncbi:S41 family peptidase [Chlamydiales bacterium]|nr:S41 family peptidase [Chlamydiales bacterium]
MKYFIFSLLSLTLFAFNEPEPLTFTDIKPIMKEILSKHVDQNKISTELIQESFLIYINQADPHKIYLLDSEVSPWVNMDSFDLLQILAAYKKGDFSKYIELNTQIESAMTRSRILRQQMTPKEKPLLFSEENLKPPRLNFATSPLELKERQKEEIVRYISKQKNKFGANRVNEKQNEVLSQFEKKITQTENQFTINQLPQNEKESLLTINILKSLAKSLDAYTAFLAPSEAYDMRARLEKGLYGVGVIFKEGLDGIYVEKIIENSPAEKEGTIAINDHLVEIDHQPIQDLTFTNVLDRIRIDNDNQITLTLEKETPSTSYEVTLEREALEIKENRVDISYEPFGNGIIGVIKLYSFYDNQEGVNSEQDIRDAIKYLEGIGNLRGLVLDLRDNNGGFLTQAVKVAGLFITNGVVVISHYQDGKEKLYRDIDGRTSFDGPLTVLVSNRTASAAEIVAQSLQDYGVALVVGDSRTYGKGTIQSQTVIGSPGSNYFKVTVGKYFTTSGKTPDQVGVLSDIIIPGTKMQGGFGEEYLEYPLESDRIHSAFNDSLDDVKEEIKPWFIKYYTPTLQHQTDALKQWIPLLRKNSEYRVENDKNYKFLLKKTDPNEEEDETTEEEVILHKGRKNYGTQDLQLAEAVNITKDMIKIELTQMDVIGVSP